MHRILFVCVENSNRSQMAEAFARIHGAGKVDVRSGGSRPSGQVNPRAVAAMAELGYDLSGHTSGSVDEAGPGPWDVLVTMGCGDECPWVAARKREDWDLPDPKELPEPEFRRVRDEIELRVIALIARLDQEGGSGLRSAD